MESSACLLLLLIVGIYGVNGWTVKGKGKTPTRLAEYHDFEEAETRSNVSATFLFHFVYLLEMGGSVSGYAVS